jgi:hypothetical protein
MGKAEAPAAEERKQPRPFTVATKAFVVACPPRGENQKKRRAVLTIALPTSGHDPAADGRQSVRWRRFRVVILGLARLMDCTDGIRIEDGNEQHKAQRSDAERQETQNFFHFDSYAFSSSR